MKVYLVTFDVPITMRVTAEDGDTAAEMAATNMADVAFPAMEAALDGMSWGLGFYDDDPEWEEAPDVS